LFPAFVRLQLRTDDQSDDGDRRSERRFDDSSLQGHVIETLFSAVT
jgi:hypothetical protein